MDQDFKLSISIVSASLVALVSHILFHRKEPDPITFCACFFLAYGVLSALLIGVCNLSFCEALVTTILMSITYVGVLLFSIAVYRLSPLHPLAGFPGPRSAIVSKWWMVHRILAKGGRHTKLQELHEVYGPWLRIGPNELSVNMASAIRSIYKLDRGSFYQGTPARGDTLITLVDRASHAQRRQAWAKAVTNDALQHYILSAQVRTQELTTHLASEMKDYQVVDLDKWINLFFMDLMGDMGFSGGFETMKAGKDPEGWMEMLAMGVMFVSSMGQVPWLKNVVQLLPQRGPIESFHKFTEAKIQDIRARQSSGNMRHDIFSILLDPSDGSPILTPDEAAADATLIVVAATDTSVQAVLTLFRYIAVDKKRQQILLEEVKGVFSSVGGIELLDVPGLLRLPYLDACIQESMRIVPPGPFGPPRTSGPHGTNILGIQIPPNTTVHIPVYTVHRDPLNFGVLADQYLPERWIQGSDNQKAADEDLVPCNREAFVPFSAGYSSCIGKQLALQNIKILIAHLINAFEFSAAPGFGPDKYDASFKEYGLWSHDHLQVTLARR